MNSHELKELHHANFLKMKRWQLPEPKFDVRKPYRDIDIFKNEKDSEFTIDGPSKSRSEDLRRFKRHAKYSDDKQSFARSLRRMSEGKGIVGTAASSYFMRKCKTKWVGQVLNLIDDRSLSDVRFVTLVPLSWRFKTGKISTINFCKLKRQIKTQFKRAEITKAIGFLCGVFDAEYDGDCLQVHLHMIVAGEKVGAMENLRGRDEYCTSEEIRFPLKIQKLVNARRQTSYCFKTFWGFAPRFADESNVQRKSRQIQRMPLSVEAECLQKLHETAVGDLLVFNSVRLGRAGLKGTEACHQNNQPLPSKAEEVTHSDDSTNFKKVN